MGVFNGVFPVLPGKEEAMRAYAAGINGPRRAEFGAAQAALGITRQTWTYQQTPDGSLVLVWFEAADVEKVFEDFAQATDEYNIWSRSQIREITGIDMSEPSDAPPPEVIVEWSA
jgi:hypothetical protein